MPKKIILYKQERVHIRQALDTLLVTRTQQRDELLAQYSKVNHLAIASTPQSRRISTSQQEKLATLKSQIKQTQDLLSTYSQSPDADEKWVGEMDVFLKGNLEYYQSNPSEVTAPAFEEMLKTINKEQEGLRSAIGKMPSQDITTTRSSSSGPHVNVRSNNASSSSSSNNNGGQNRNSSSSNNVGSPQSTGKIEPRTSGTSIKPNMRAPQSGILQALHVELERPAQMQKPEVDALFQNLERLEQEKREITRLNGSDVQARTKESQTLLQQQTVLEHQRTQSILEQEDLRTQITKLERELKTKSDKREQDRIKAELLGLTERLTGVESQVAILMVEYEIKAKKREALQRFQNHPNLLLFYRTVHIKLEEIFISMKAVAGGFVNPVEGNVATAKSIVEGLGDMVSIAPLVGSAVEKFLKWGVSKVLGKIDDARQNNTAANASGLVTLSEVKKIAEGVARQLTEGYAEQLLMLVTLEEEQNAANRLQMGIQKVKTMALKQAPCPPAKQLASFTVLWMADVIYDAHQIKDEPLDVLLLAQVRQKSPPGKVKAFWGEITTKLSLQGLRTTQDEFWSPEEVLVMPEVKVRTLAGGFEHYANGTLNPKKYGWRIADLADVQILKLQHVPNPENTRQDPVGAEQLQAFGKQVHVNEMEARQAKVEVERLRKENEALRQKQEEDNIKRDEESKAMKEQLAALQKVVFATPSPKPSPQGSPLLFNRTSNNENNFASSPSALSQYSQLPTFDNSASRVSEKDRLMALINQAILRVFKTKGFLSHTNFYHTDLTKEAATALLQGQGRGLFLIRPSSVSDAIALSYVNEQLQVEHIAITYVGDKFTLPQKPAMELTACFEQYMKIFTTPLPVTAPRVSLRNVVGKK